MTRPTGTLRFAAAGILLALAGCWIEPAEKAELEQADSDVRLDTRVREMLRRSADAWNRGDLEGFLSVYLESDRTTYVGGSGVRTGYAEIRRRYAPRFRPGAGRDSLRFEDLRVRFVDGDEDVAVGIARWVLHRGGEVTASGPFTLVLRRADGSWKIVHDHSSSSPPPDGTPSGDGAGEPGGP